MAHILVIDDEESIRRMLRVWLENEGHTVSEASNGEEGVRCYRAGTAELIITDLIMPDKEGIETIIELKEVNSGVKIIAISGGGRNTPTGYLDMAEHLGAVRTFNKPIRKQDLMAAVAELLSIPDS
ncbi:MAG: response regulator [Thermodesulfobacteriota bacterium]|nr:response regulator [Thermodesulfobacteriota bacterium]